MLDNFRKNLTGEKKILILFSILLIFNVSLFFNLFAYMIIVKHLSFSVLHDIGTIISAIIIFGFISTRLTKLKEQTDGTIYEIGYLIIMGLLSLTISYFNQSANGASLWEPFIEMFRILSVILIFTFIATKSKSFKSLLRGDHSLKTIIWQIIICSVLGVLASYYTMDINGIPANSRNLVVMISALLGGPYLGMPVAIISGLWRFSMGGITALPCCVSTIMAGIIGSLVYKWNGDKFLKHYKAGLLMLLFTGFDMWIITMLTTRPEGLLIANSVYAPMTFSAVLGMLLFTMFLGEKKEEAEMSDDLKQEIDENSEKISVNSDKTDKNTDRIIEISQELKDSKREMEFYKNKINESQRELQAYKDKIDSLENELKELKNKL